MSTISPGRLLNVDDAADLVDVSQTNFEILTEELFKRQGTYVSGAPTTTIGPPTSGAHVLDELWKDALGATFVCTVAGTPGMWKQITPAAVLADPSSGTIPTGYLIWNVTDGVIKRHAGSYAWRLPARTVTSAQVLTSSQTVTVPTPGEFFALSNNTGTNEGDASIIFNLTGIPAEHGSAIYLHMRAEKGVTTMPWTSIVNVQINGVNVVLNLTTGAATTAETADAARLVVWNPIKSTWTFQTLTIF